MIDPPDELLKYIHQARIACELDPGNPDLGCRLALLQSAVADYPGAYLTLSGVVRDHPSHVNALVDLATVEMLLEDFDNAAEHFRRALRIDPGNEEARRNLDYF